MTITYICAIMYVARELAYNKKEEHLKLQVNVASKNRLDTLSKQMSVYFFITSTNKVRSDKMIQMYLRSLIT